MFSSFFGTKSSSLSDNNNVIISKKKSISISTTSLDDEKQLTPKISPKISLLKNEISFSEIKIDDNNIDTPLYTVSTPLSIMLKDDTSKVLKFFSTLNGIKNDEKMGLEKLYLYIKQDKLTKKLLGNISNYTLCCDDLVLTYYSSFSNTNPDIIGCWKKWMIYLDKDPFKNISIEKVKEFFKTFVWNVGYCKDRKPVWFVSTKNYKDTFSSDVTNLASVLFIKGLFCNKNKNKFDITSLRLGVNVYVDLSHWGWNLISWSKIKTCKDCLVAAPYGLMQIFGANIPTFILLLKNFASKVVPPYSMKKFISLSDKNEYFEKYAEKHQTPDEYGGTLKINAFQWLTDRGYL